VEYLIRAMPDVIRNLPKAKLMIIGDGLEKERLVNLANELKLGNSILFAGKIKNEDLPKFYASADVFVGPSIITEKGDTEGLGVVFLEAIASGTCVIGTNVGGIPDIIKNNEGNKLFDFKGAESKMWNDWNRFFNAPLP